MQQLFKFEAHKYKKVLKLLTFVDDIGQKLLEAFKVFKHGINFRSSLMFNEDSSNIIYKFHLRRDKFSDIKVVKSKFHSSSICFHNFEETRKKISSIIFQLLKNKKKKVSVSPWTQLCWCSRDENITLKFTFRGAKQDWHLNLQFADNQYWKHATQMKARNALVSFHVRRARWKNTMQFRSVKYVVRLQFKAVVCDNCAERQNAKKSSPKGKNANKCKQMQSGILDGAEIMRILFKTIQSHK